MEVYQLIVPAIALVIVTFLSVLAEMVASAQESTPPYIAGRRKDHASSQRVNAEESIPNDSAASQLPVAQASKRNSSTPATCQPIAHTSERAND